MWRPDLMDPDRIERTMPIAILEKSLRRVRYGEPIIVVSGLPRSGTSMMMQMLHAGGVATVTDGQRLPDESNPKGYFELEAVKELHRAPDKTWLRETRGRAVKIIAFLLEHLPDTHNYKVIFMQRKMKEVLASQSTMLDRLGGSDDTGDGRMRQLWINHLARTRTMIAHRSCFDVHHVRYDEVIADRQGQAERVRRFLRRPLDVNAMAAVVSPELYRNRH
jgi:hypothetical protein